MSNKKKYIIYKCKKIVIEFAFVLCYNYKVNILIFWGCNGFDGDNEPLEAGSDKHHLKMLNFLNLNANDNLAYAA